MGDDTAESRHPGQAKETHADAEADAEDEGRWTIDAEGDAETEGDTETEGNDEPDDGSRRSPRQVKSGLRGH